MMNVRTRIALTAALGLFVSVFAVSVVADDDHQHGEHDHAAMQAEKKISAAMKKLSPANTKQAQAQRFCPLMPRTRLGSDGTPIKVMVQGQPVFVCCDGCVEDAQKNGKNTLAAVKKLTRSSAALAKLPAKDRSAAEEQKYCAIASKNLLGTMGAPIKLNLNGQTVLLCCKGCVSKAKANPKATLAKVKELKKDAEHGDHDHDDHDH